MDGGKVTIFVVQGVNSVSAAKPPVRPLSMTATRRLRPATLGLNLPAATRCCREHILGLRAVTD